MNRSTTRQARNLYNFAEKKKKKKKNSSKTRTHRFVPGHTSRSLKILSTLFSPPPHRPSLLLGQPTPFIKYLLNPHPIRTSRLPPYICSPNHLDTEILLNFSEKNHKVLYWKIKKKMTWVLILKCENWSLCFFFIFILDKSKEIGATFLKIWPDLLLSIENFQALLLPFGPFQKNLASFLSRREMKL